MSFEVLKPEEKEKFTGCFQSEEQRISLHSPILKLSFQRRYDITELSSLPCVTHTRTHMHTHAYTHCPLTFSVSLTHSYLNCDFSTPLYFLCGLSHFLSGPLSFPLKLSLRATSFTVATYRSSNEVQLFPHPTSNSFGHPDSHKYNLKLDLCGFN